METIVTRHVNDCSWNQREDRGDLRWKFLVDATEMDSHGLSAGIIEVPVGSELSLHHHQPQEIYVIRAGEGLLLQTGGKIQQVRKDSVVYIPQNERHGLKNTGDVALEVLWIFPTDCWQEIEYIRD
ncbi:MAG: cupin domain-containing protein [Rhizobiales bacterium]|nr:cupin domain-containing protein [Hyphomicrobiales bacterium]